MTASSSSLIGRLGSLLALALVTAPVVVACGGNGENITIGSDRLNGDGGDDGAADGGSRCKTSADCGPSAACGFATGAKCGDYGICFSTNVPTCAAFSAGCSCGTENVNVACSPLPTGYAPGPEITNGACSGAHADAGPCTTDADCGSDGVCGFPRAEACTATGTCHPKSGVNCNSVIAGCACDGTFVNLGCNQLPDTESPKPLLHAGDCTDGG